MAAYGFFVVTDLADDDSADELMKAMGKLHEGMQMSARLPPHMCEFLWEHIRLERERGYAKQLNEDVEAANAGVGESAVGEGPEQTTKE